MAELAPPMVWAYRGLFVLLAALVLFLRLLPLGNLAGDWPGPNILLCLAFAWVLRRPDYVPALLIALIFLLEDMLVMRPPGLWTAIVVVAAEFLRSRAALARSVPFMVEWLMVAGVMAAAVVGYRLAVTIAMLPQVSLAQSLLQLAITILCYPVVVLVSQLAFGVRKPATGEVDAYGRRI